MRPMQPPYKVKYSVIFQERSTDQVFPNMSHQEKPDLNMIEIVLQMRNLAKFYIVCYLILWNFTAFWKGHGSKWQT